MDLAVVIELLGDYDEWRKVFDEDLPARQEFSESMVAGPVDEGKAVSYTHLTLPTICSV